MKRIDILLWFLTLIASVFMVVQKSMAAETQPFFRGVRAMGMGGAAVAVVNDETALFLNPAGLGKLRRGYVAMANPEFETTHKTISTFGTNLNNYIGAMDPQALLALAQTATGENLHAKLQVLPAFVTTNFGIGAYAKYSVDALFTASTNQMQFNYLNDYAAVLGYCFRLWEGRFKIGVSGKIVNRVYASQTINSGATGLSLANMVSEGTGLGFDGGLMLTAPWAWLPTLSVAGHDIGNTYFTASNGIFFKPATRPPAQAQSVDVGLAVFPYDGKTTRFSITAEWRDILTPETLDVYRRIHTGMEINFNDTFFLRVGMNQRYYTAGLELDIDRQQIQFATYGEEIGTSTAFKEDRRFIAQYVFRF